MSIESKKRLGLALCGCAMLSAVALGACSDLAQARKVFVRYKDSYAPREKYQGIYAGKYQKYRKLYQSDRLQPV